MVPRWVKLSNLCTNYVFDTDKQAQRCMNEGHECIMNKWESMNEDQGSTNMWTRARAAWMRAGQHEHMNNNQVSANGAWMKARTAQTMARATWTYEWQPGQHEREQEEHKQGPGTNKGQDSEQEQGEHEWQGEHTQMMAGAVWMRAGGVYVCMYIYNYILFTHLWQYLTYGLTHTPAKPLPFKRVWVYHR